MRTLTAIAVVVVLVLTSCGEGDSAGVGIATTSSSDTDVATAPDTDVATSPVTPAKTQPVTGSITLRGDGLGVVDFGQDGDEVTVVLETVIGSPPTHTGAQAEWVEYVGWDDLGLFVGFDTPAAQGYTGVSRFVGWEYWGPHGGTGFVTAEGAGIGTTYPELQALYGDRLEVTAATDECVSGTVYNIVLGGSMYGTLDRAPADDAQVSLLQAGVGVGC